MASFIARAAILAWLNFAVVAVAAGPDEGKSDEVGSLIAGGEFTKAEGLLRSQIADPDAPIVEPAAVQLEILHRTRRDFPLTEVEVFEQLRESLPEVTMDDVRDWTAAGFLQHRLIDGEARYFRRAASNLFRLDNEAKRRRDAVIADQGESPKKKFDLPALIRQIHAEHDQTGAIEVLPVRHCVTYTLAVKDSCKRVVPGAKVRAWLPYPQEYRQQSHAKLLSSSPKHKGVASSGSPHRNVYFEETIGDDAEPPRFEIAFEFVTAAYCPDLAPEAVQPYDTQSDLYRKHTAQRLPHIALTPEVRELAATIVGEETNPLRKALAIFAWVSNNLSWVGEMEYGIIPSLSEKGLTARCGDCGVQGMTFITLCRAAGVPARWQSGFGTKPGEENMHDWAEFYVEPWGWLPADASYGLQKDDDPRVRDFFCGHMDPYRLIVNLDYARSLDPPKTSFRSEPNDFQRGEIEIDGHNLYFDDWTWSLKVESFQVESFKTETSPATMGLESSD